MNNMESNGKNRLLPDIQIFGANKEIYRVLNEWM